MPEQEPNAPLLLRYKSFTLNVDDIPDAMFLKLLQNGFAKRMHDCASGVAKRLTLEGKSDGEVYWTVQALQEAALQELLQGTWGQAKAKPPAGAKAEQAIELMMVKVAKEGIRANAKLRGDKAPKGQNMLNHVQVMLSNAAPQLRAEAERRLAVTKELG